MPGREAVSGHVPSFPTMIAFDHSCSILHVVGTITASPAVSPSALRSTTAASTSTAAPSLQFSDILIIFWVIFDRLVRVSLRLGLLGGVGVNDGS